MIARHRRQISRWHRLLGLATIVPLAGWIASSFVLHGVGLALPNGLQGVYHLKAAHDVGGRMEEEALLPPTAILGRMAEDGFDRIYWLRLEPLGGVPAYIVKPGPFDLERVYDASTGERLDPLPDSVLRRVADDELQGTRVAEMRSGAEFNRYYTVERVPAVFVRMEGEQPSELVLSRSSGRVLRRTDPLAAWFQRAYRTVHVWQWGDSIVLFTTLLYGLAGMSLVLVVLGYILWWDRRHARKRWTRAVRPVRRVHARLAPFAGFFLATQMLVGAYLWFNLGPIEPRFRGQGSFRHDWQGGIAVTDTLAPVSRIAEALPEELVAGEVPIQRYEWRRIDGEPYWIAYPVRNRPGILIHAPSGRRTEALPPEIAAAAAADVVLGRPVGAVEPSEEYWMDFNARVPTYRIRFDDPDATDVHVSQHTGEVIQRRPAIWRAFGPFLLYHTFGFTGNPWWDTVLLTILQLSILTMMLTGWRLARPTSRRRE